MKKKIYIHPLNGKLKKKIIVKPKAMRTTLLPHTCSVTYQNSFQLHHKTDKIWTAVQPLEETEEQSISAFSSLNL